VCVSACGSWLGLTDRKGRRDGWMLGGFVYKGLNIIADKNRYVMHSEWVFLLGRWL
jgi:hypothetical protein